MDTARVLLAGQPSPRNGPVVSQYRSEMELAPPTEPSSFRVPREPGLTDFNEGSSSARSDLSFFAQAHSPMPPNLSMYKTGGRRTQFDSAMPSKMYPPGAPADPDWQGLIPFERDAEQVSELCNDSVLA